jgi:hypothetical protein
MDYTFVNDLKRTLEDAIEYEDWKCIEEALEIINDYIDTNPSDDDIDTDEF